MDCPNCGVYNPEDRLVCWRCDQELPKPEEPKRKRGQGGMSQRRLWIIIGAALVIWILLTWLLPLLFSGGGVAP
jgi:predicted nucleic acid-binding Zn ribbon protein